MTPERAPEHLCELSSDVRAAVVIGADGAAAGCSDASSADELARLARELVLAVDHAAPEKPPAELEAHVVGGSVYMARDGRFTLVAITRRAALASLMLFDLRTTLGEIAA